MRFLIGSDRDKMLDHVLGLKVVFAAVEAEWGDKEIGILEGAIAAYNHHEGRRGLMPSLAYNVTDKISQPAVVVLSHFDLDTLLGCMALMGEKPKDRQAFCKLSAFIDVHGAHKLDSAKEPEWEANDVMDLYAWWAWSKQNRLTAPSDGSPEDCTGFVTRAAAILTQILRGDQGLVQEGRKFQADMRDLNLASYKDRLTYVIMREHSEFVNHLYSSPEGGGANGVVAYSTRDGSIKLSLADPVEGVSCSQIARGLWGDKAGGHAGIAGSPRGEKMPETDLRRAAEALDAAISAKTTSPHEAVAT